MGHESKVKELFFENPSKEFYLRQIARLTRSPKSTVSAILKRLEKDSLIIRKKSEPFDRYQANVTDSDYIFYKKISILEKIQKSRMIDHIVEKTNPRAIILFGSCAKGEYRKDSDIDLFIQTVETGLDLEKFKLGHVINPIFRSDMINIAPGLRQNILNGIILYGMVRYEKVNGL
jgi:predicted nucleotidyltransferase